MMYIPNIENVIEMTMRDLTKFYLKNIISKWT